VMALMSVSIKAIVWSGKGAGINFFFCGFVTIIKLLGLIETVQ